MDASGCVHCGLCLPTCPTYQVTGVEAESPRGRVLLLQELAQGKDLGPQAAAYLDDCLDCRACEAVCPSHVETGHLVGGWREARGGAATPALRAARRAMRLFLGSPRGLAWLQRLARGAAGGGLGIRRLVPLVAPPGVLRLAKGLPAPMPRSLSRGGVRRPGSPGGVRVAFFAGCVMDAVYAETNLRTADLLALAGAQVEALQGATCCGALAEHAADLATARALARRNIEAFERSGAEWLVVNAAGCSAFLREYGRLFAAEPSWRERAERVAARTVDALVFLAGRSLPELPARPGRVAVHDACHHAHAQGIRREPRELLRRAGYEILELTAADRCCGAAGSYSLTHPAMAGELLGRKLASVPEGVETVAAANPGCLLHIQAGLREQGRGTTALHPLDLVWQAYRDAGRIPGREGR